MNSSTAAPRCYLFNASDALAWGNCCDQLGIVPKPLWLVLLLSLPIEAILASTDTQAVAGMYEKKSDRTAAVLLGYNLVSLGLIAYQFDWTSCEPTAVGVFECYQGVLFMFYNSTAALASMTLWMLTIIRKYHPHLYKGTRFIVLPNFIWQGFDKSNFPLRGTDEVVRIWFIISKSTGLFWYNKVGVLVALVFGGASHVVPMFFVYFYIVGIMWITLILAHTLRLGYAARARGQPIRATLVAIFVFHPTAAVVSAVSLLLLPLNIVWRCFVNSPKPLGVPDEEVDEASDMLQLIIKKSERLKFTVDVRATESLYDLKCKVIEMYGDDKLEPTDINILLDDSVLVRDEYPLQEYELSSGIELQMSITVRAEPPEPLCNPTALECLQYVGLALLICICCPFAACYAARRLYRYRKRLEENAEDIAYGKEKRRMDDLEMSVSYTMTPGIAEDTDATRLSDKVVKRQQASNAINYIKALLRNLCLFDSNGNVILFASATTFLGFSLGANYGILLYSGAPVFEAPLIDFYARRSEQWFQCTAENFIDLDAFGLLDFVGLASGIAAGLLQLVDFISKVQAPAPDELTN